ncbi:MAG TPA: hypothetical protein V6C96_00625, partial [Vampirovibrionales bacterium]
MATHIFITDPFSQLVYGHDSSLALMREALILGDNVKQCELKDIFWKHNSLKINCHKLQLSNNNKPIQNVEKEEIDLNSVNKTCIWMRKDPPVNKQYIQACQLLRLAGES